jgi:hypothetical protein
MFTRIAIALSMLAAAGIGGANMFNSNTAAPDDTPKRDGNFVVHEWGTFTTVSGSNGTVLVGLHHDEEALPKFVYHRSRMEKGFDGMQVKMETPVIYIYSDAEREVAVKVGFPKGAMTQWYPQVRGLAPAVDDSKSQLSNGMIDWGTVRVLAPGVGAAKMPATEAGDPWIHARETKANILRVCGASFNDSTKEATQHERFLFYRGLGNFALPLTARVAADGRIELANNCQEKIARPILLHVTKDKIYCKTAGDVDANGTASAEPVLPETTIDGAMDLVAAELAGAGLYADEARAMVNTWRKSYFQTLGFRILYLLPRAKTDAVLPLTVEPKPKETVRVMVGRLDLLLPEHEEKAKKTIRESQTMRQAEAELGRFAEPIVRYVRDTTNDAALRASAEALLAGTR